LHNYQLLDANSVADSMVTGEGLISSALNIASGFGTSNPITDPKRETVEQIDRLITLLALQKTDNKDISTLLDLLDGNEYEKYSTRLGKRLSTKLHIKDNKKLSKQEYKDQAKLGLESFLGYSKGMVEATKNDFINEPNSVAKGYMKETFNNDITLLTAPLSKKSELEKQGYIFVRRESNKLNEGRPQGLFKIANLEVKRVNGALGLQSTKNRGTTISDMINREFKDMAIKDKNIMFRKELDRHKAEYFSRTDNSKTKMFPMYNQYGAIINFRYTMSSQEKSELLDMEGRGTQNLSRSFSITNPSVSTNTHNRTVLSKLYKDYKENYHKNKKDYIEIKSKVIDGDVSKLSDEDKEFSRMWSRLPKETQMRSKELFGKNGIVIRKDLAKVVFGYDEFTIANTKIVRAQGDNFRKHVRVWEKGWQDLMQIAKNNIVIKTPEVFVGNITSNIGILMVQGINPVKAFKLIRLAQKELIRYEKDNAELMELRRDRISGKKGTSARERELQKDIDSNTVKPLIDAGLYQSIVEDINIQDDSNKWSKMANDTTSKYVQNETVNTALQYAFLSSKTKVYQSALKATQVSDLYFRYAQYYDALGTKGHSKELALRNATDNFVNYEDPINKLVLYGDRMGPFFFIKYFTRIQKVVMKLAKKHPVRMGLDVGQQMLFGYDKADIYDVGILDRGIISPYDFAKIPSNFMEIITPSGLDILVP